MCVCLSHTWSNVWRNPVVLTVGCTTDLSGRHQGGCSVPWTHTRVLTTKNYLASRVNNAKVEKTRDQAFVISLTNSSVFLPCWHFPHLVFANLHKILVQLPAFTQMRFMLRHTFFWAWCSYTLRKKRNDKNHSINPKDLTMWPRGGGANNECPAPVFEESILNSVYIKGCQEMEHLKEKQQVHNLVLHSS